MRLLQELYKRKKAAGSRRTIGGRRPKGKLLRIKEGYNPNSSSMGSVVFVLPAALWVITAIFGAVVGILSPLFMRKIDNMANHKIGELFLRFKKRSMDREIKKTAPTPGKTIPTAMNYGDIDKATRGTKETRMKKMVIIGVLLMLSLSVGGWIFGQGNMPGAGGEVRAAGAVGVVGGQEQELVEVDRLIGSGKYSEALALINEGIRSGAQDPMREALFIKKLADFYRDICGDMKRAAMNYRRVLESAIPEDHQLKPAAGEALSQIAQLESRYQKEDAWLSAAMARAQQATRNVPAVKEDIAQLEEFIRGKPGYYLIHEVYYVLALNYRELKSPGREYRCLKAAMGHKPGIVFYLPVKARAEKALAAYNRSIAQGVTRGMLWLLVVVTVVVFYFSRPWRWIGVKHIILLFVLVLSWWVVFTLSHIVVGALFINTSQKHAKKTSFCLNPDVFTNSDAKSLMGWGRRPPQSQSAAVKPAGEPVEEQAYLFAGPGSPGSEVVKPLFWYGVLGVMGVFVFSLGISRLGMKKFIPWIGGLFGILLFVALSALFYLKYCDQAGAFRPGGGIWYYIGGQVRMNSEEPEPYVLTNPRAYPDLKVSNIVDPYLKDWVIKHCPFTQGGKGSN